MICQVCKYDHSDSERPRCDRSDLEIKHDALTLAAEKLVEALEFYANATVDERVNDGALAINALAEYRKKLEK